MRYTRADLVHACLAAAANSRRMWLALPRGSRDLSFARDWVAKARAWRIDGERELALNRAFLRENPSLAASLGLQHLAA